MNKPNPQENKRRYERLRSYCLVRYNRVDDQSNPTGKMTNVKNISEGGLMLTSYEPLPISATIKVCINLPGREKPLETFAKVMRCVRVSEEEDVYHVGIAFLDIADQDRREISQHVDMILQDKRMKKLVEKRPWWQFWRKKKIKMIPNTNNAFFTTGNQKPPDIKPS
jgi:c-di-GMP-binding flagellar brake protein YcgR